MYKVALVAMISLLELGLSGPSLAFVPAYALNTKLSTSSASSDKAEQLIARRRRRRRTPKKPPPPPPPQNDTSKPAPADNSANSGVIMTSRRGPARVDFDDRLIQGQTNKSGAIYIFERKSSDLRSMVRRRKSFRKEIYRSIE